jgi:hypothetical protein
MALYRTALFLSRFALGMVIVCAISLGWSWLQTHLGFAASPSPSYPSFLFRMGEGQWLKLIQVVAIAAGTFVSASALLYPNAVNRTIANFSVGFLTFLSLYQWLNRIPYDTLAEYGIVSKGHWEVFVPFISMAIAILAGLATAPLIWRNTSRFAQGWIILSGGIGAFTLCWYSLMSSVLMLGIAD